MANKSPVNRQSASNPAGGGDVRGLGETFQPDLNSGVGNYRVPLDLLPGIRNFQPSLALGYSTGAGNGAWGSGLVSTFCRHQPPHVSGHTLLQGRRYIPVRRTNGTHPRGLRQLQGVNRERIRAVQPHGVRLAGHGEVRHAPHLRDYGREQGRIRR